MTFWQAECEHGRHGLVGFTRIFSGGLPGFFWRLQQDKEHTEGFTPVYCEELS